MEKNEDFVWDDSTLSFVEANEPTSKEDEPAEGTPKEGEPDESGLKLVDGEFVEVDKIGDEGDEGDEEDIDNSIDNDKDEDENIFKILASDLKEIGILKTDLPEDIDQDSFFDLMKNNTQKEAENYFNLFIEDLDEDGKAFLEFKKSGGDTKLFFETYQQMVSEPDIESIDSYDEKVDLIKFYYKTYEGKSVDEVEDFITFLEDRGKIDDYFETYSSKISEQREIKKAQLIEQQLEQAKAQEEAVSKFVDEVVTYVSSDDTDIVFSDDDRKSMRTYMSKPVIEVGSNQMITKMQKDLSDALTDPKKAAKLAKFLKTNLDFTGLVSEIQKKEVNKFESALKKAKSKRINSSTSSKKTRGSKTFNIDDYI